MVLRQGGDLAQGETFYSPQKGPGNCTRPLPSASKAETGRAAVLSVFLMNLAARPLRQLRTVTVGGGIAALSEEEEAAAEEGLLKADAVNEEDPERDRATQV